MSPSNSAGRLCRLTFDAVIRGAVLGEVVGPDLFGTFARPDLPPALRHAFALLLFALLLVETGAQDLHRFRAVLLLTLLVLAVDDQAGGDVGDSHRAVG